MTKSVQQHLLQILINMIITAATDKENLDACKEIWQNSICKDILQKEVQNVAFKYWPQTDEFYEMKRYIIQKWFQPQIISRSSNVEARDKSFNHNQYQKGLMYLHLT